MASIFDVATVERVREAYASTGAVPKMRVDIERNRRNGIIYACPIGALALKAEPTRINEELNTKPSTRRVIALAGIDYNPATQGFRDGFDDYNPTNNYQTPEDQIDYDLGYTCGSGMRIELGIYLRR